jgi:2-oxoglutarate dehydrogenase E1 component
MYKRIAEQKAQLDKYVEKLIAEGTFTKEDIDVSL